MNTQKLPDVPQSARAAAETGPLPDGLASTHWLVDAGAERNGSERTERTWQQFLTALWRTLAVWTT